MVIRFRNVLVFTTSLIISTVFAYFLYLTSALRPFKGEFGLGSTLSFLTASFALSMKTKDRIIKTTLDIASSFFGLSLLLLVLTYFMSWIELALEYYIQSLVILGVVELVMVVMVSSIRE